MSPEYFDVSMSGHGPSSLFLLDLYQEAFKVPLVVQLTDDEKFLFKPDLKLEEVRAYRVKIRFIYTLKACYLKHASGTSVIFPFLRNGFEFYIGFCLKKWISAVLTVVGVASFRLPFLACDETSKC